MSIRSSLPRLRIRYADVAATLALVIAGSGTAYAVTALPNGSVTTAAIKNGAVTTPKLHSTAVTAAKLATGSVGSAAVANNSLTVADLAGTDVSGGLSLNLTANSCASVALSVGGARPGQVVMFSWTGSSDPDVLMTGPARVSANDTVVVPFCNSASTALSISNVPVRIVTFS